MHHDARLCYIGFPKDLPLEMHPIARGLSARDPQQAVVEGTSRLPSSVRKRNSHLDRYRSAHMKAFQSIEAHLLIKFNLSHCLPTGTQMPSSQKWKEIVSLETYIFEKDFLFSCTIP